MIESKYIKKTFCKICEIYVYGKQAHANEHHRREKNCETKCPNCKKTFPNYAEGWFTLDKKSVLNPLFRNEKNVHLEKEIEFKFM